MTAVLREAPTSPGPAIHDIRAQIAAISLDNIANIAKAAFDPSSGVLPLWFGEGDVASPAFLAEAVSDAIAAGQTFYSHQSGVPHLRETLSRYYQDLYGLRIGTNRTTVTAGGMQAIMLAVQMLVNAGDNIIVIDPVWPNITGMVKIAGGEVRSVGMSNGDTGWTLDVARVRAACDSRTKAIFYASPGNPTGAMIPLEVQRELLNFARSAGIWLIADEVYHRLVFGERCAPSILTISDPEDRVLVINSFSKSYAMTGWRLGWLVHPPSVAPILAMMTQYTSSGTTTFLQYAAATALRDGEPFVAEMNAYCAKGADIVCSALERMPRVRMATRPKAAMYAFFEIDGMPDSKAACLDILNKTNVGLAPGVFFGPDAKSFLRICFCRSPDSLHEAMDKLAPALS